MEGSTTTLHLNFLPNCQVPLPHQPEHRAEEPVLRSQSVDACHSQACLWPYLQVCLLICKRLRWHKSYRHTGRLTTDPQDTIINMKILLTPQSESKASSKVLANGRFVGRISNCVPSPKHISLVWLGYCLWNNKRQFHQFLRGPEQHQLKDSQGKQ